MLDYHRAYRLAQLAREQERLATALKLVAGSGLPDKPIRDKMAENSAEIGRLFVEAREL